MKRAKKAVVVWLCGDAHDCDFREWWCVWRSKCACSNPSPGRHVVNSCIRKELYYVKYMPIATIMVTKWRWWLKSKCPCSDPRPEQYVVNINTCFMRGTASIIRLFQL